MSKKEKINQKLEELKFKVAKKSNLLERKEKLLSDLFKYETLYLETAQGMPLTKTSEFYVNNRIEKKKYLVNDKDRIFSLEYPKN
ncbi:uncharacterized protein VNE69_01233 [Vairimorpha necatrix]|uniref:Chromatin modification-related protein EAF6 n=1 Tax=Vairimorpha necatrix TaxID=6039 RepID=A0AAX4J8J1_9MICR